MKTVFITGSGRRIGRGLALKFAELGWNVGLHYFQSQEMAERTHAEVLSFGVKSSIVRFDVKNYGDFRLGMQKSIDEVGIPDVLINNSGIFPRAKTLMELSVEDWNSAMNTNMRSAFFSAKIFAEFARDNSKIINIASIGGLEIWKNRIPYNVSKAGLIQLTKALARELAPKIAVNAICPGTIIIPNEKAEDSSEINVSRIPMNRYGNIDDIFDAVKFFSECSQFITGQILNVDGGYHLVR